ncbi:MAG: hypothetical protein ACFB15_19235 [Cyclobacteriaceae bacterium]
MNLNPKNCYWAVIVVLLGLLGSFAGSTNWGLLLEEAAIYLSYQPEVTQEE